MARYGCFKGGSGGVIVPGPGIQVTGDGTPTRPRRIRIVADPHVTELVEQCISGQLCRGLQHTGECIAVGISGDAGNAVRIAEEDGGLYGTCPANTECGYTADTLPPATFCTGTWGAGWANGPVSTLGSFTQGVAMGLPLSWADTYRLCDGTWIVAPYATPNAGALIPRVDTRWSRVTLGQIRSITIQHDPSYGECAIQSGLTTLDEVLFLTRGRQVLSLLAPSEVSDPESGTVRDLVDTVTRACSAGNIMLHLTGAATDADRARLQDARLSGVETGMVITTQEEADRHTPAKLAADGIAWVYVHRGLPDTVFETYKTAGLQVVLTRALLRSDAARAQRLGLRAVMADDPGYVCGRLKARTASPWCAGTVPAGQINMDTVARDQYSGKLGESASKLPTGPDPCGWKIPDQETATNADAMLLGWASPITATTYTLDWWQWWNPLGTTAASNRAGLIICAPDDVWPHDPSGASGPTSGSGRNSGYVLTHEQGAATGNIAMRIEKFTRGAAAGPSVTRNGTGASNQLPAGRWVRFRALVTPTAITYQRVSDTGNTVTYQVVLGTGGVADPSPHRGGYVWTYRQTTATTRFSSAYRNWMRS
ncbi:PI-PLC domain-containing protein [Streptomyces yaizuensis]|uniref:Uncharacterized protein n=1 Tax=Streptomyces yaizuensis TaxID=2989713 RepID=A0AA86J3R5_9ACTN|nr:hypothetical protein [Streptomyces sp. YSPA8]BDT39537.1 hypothetical protein SYYSPA8_37095 [Streptomyces sp. YSPA8]